MPRAGVTGVERGLEEPPGPDDEGRVLSVEHDSVERMRVHCTHKQCQQCREPVDLESEHIRARVTTESAIGLAHRDPVFCSRECWGEWASSG